MSGGGGGSGRGRGLPFELPQTLIALDWFHDVARIPAGTRVCGEIGPVGRSAVGNVDGRDAVVVVGTNWGE